MSRSWKVAFRISGLAYLAGCAINIPAFMLGTFITQRASLSDLVGLLFYSVIGSAIALLPGFMVILGIAKWLPAGHCLWEPRQCIPWGALGGALILYLWYISLNIVGFGHLEPLLPPLWQASTWLFLVPAILVGIVTTWVAARVHREV